MLLLLCFQVFGVFLRTRSLRKPFPMGCRDLVPCHVRDTGENAENICIIGPSRTDRTLYSQGGKESDESSYGIMAGHGGRTADN